MPQRIIRDWTDSWTMQQLSSDAERFFTRLMMKADDYGRFHAEPNALKSFLFPLLPDIRSEQVRQWRDQCKEVDLIRIYTDERGREFLIINKFGQRLRTMKTDFPAPCGHADCRLSPSCCHSADILPTSRCQSGRALSVEEKRSEGKRSEESARTHEDAAIPTIDEVLAHAERIGAKKETAERFFAHHNDNALWVNQHGRLIKWRDKLITWRNQDASIKTNGNNRKNNQPVDRNQGNANAGKANQYANVGRVVPG